MKIVAISDTHNEHNSITLPEGDILIHAGDMTNTGSILETKKFNSFLRSVKDQFKHIICIAGNHDRGFETNPSLFTSLLTEGLSNCHYLMDDYVVLEGLKFYGSPWQPEFMNWSFNLKRGEDLKRVWDRIPDDTDVLITHGPPSGYLDDVGNSTRREGCLDLRVRVENIKPKLHVFGHIHRGFSNPDQIYEGFFTTFVNASICNDGYFPVNKPVVIDLPVE